MKAYKILALLKRVEKLKAGDKRVLINGFPCKVDYRIISDELFEAAVTVIKELIDEQEQAKNCSTPAFAGQSEQLVCKHCENKKALHSKTTGLCPDRFKHFEAK